MPQYSTRFKKHGEFMSSKEGNDKINPSIDTSQQKRKKTKFRCKLCNFQRNFVVASLQNNIASYFYFLFFADMRSIRDVLLHIERRISLLSAIECYTSEYP